MSEASACMGTAAPGRTLEHKGRVFTFVPALSNGALVQLEALLYDRARAALSGLRAEYTDEQYGARLDALSERYESGYYSLSSPETSKFLQTVKGQVLLLRAICGADEGELYELFTERAADVTAILKEVLGNTMPKGKAKPRPNKLTRKFRK